MNNVVNLKLEIWLETALPVVDFHPRMLFSMEKFVFCGWPTLVYSHLLLKLAGSNYKNYWSHAAQVKRKVNCVKFSLEFNSVMIAAHKEKSRLWNMAKSTWKSTFHLTCLRDLLNKNPAERHAKREICAL